LTHFTLNLVDLQKSCSFAACGLQWAGEGGPKGAHGGRDSAGDRQGSRRRGHLRGQLCGAAPTGVQGAEVRRARGGWGDQRGAGLREVVP